MKKILSLLICTLFISGCSILSTQPYIRTYFFDIGSPNSNIVENKYNLEIMSFNISGPFKERMLFRTSPYSVRFDEFNRWSMPPSAMFKRYLMMIYDSGNDTNKTAEKQFSLNGEILQLEADLQTKKVSLAIRFIFYETSTGKNIWSRTFKQQIPVPNVTGESFAAAVKYGTDNIVKELNIHLNASKK